MADDWEEPPEGTSAEAWIPSNLSLVDTRPSPELLEELGSKMQPPDSTITEVAA